MEKDIQNAIVINGEIYDFVKVSSEESIGLCNKCALREECDEIDGNIFLCDALFQFSPSPSHFVKRETK